MPETFYEVHYTIKLNYYNYVNNYPDYNGNPYKDATLVGFNPYHSRYMVLCDDGTFHGHVKMSHFETDKEIGTQFKYRLPFVEEIDGELVYSFISHHKAASDIKKDNRKLKRQWIVWIAYSDGNGSKKHFNNFEAALKYLYHVGKENVSDIGVTANKTAKFSSQSIPVCGYDEGDYFMYRRSGLSARQKKLFLKYFAEALILNRKTFKIT